jgi:F0F1-type ATP synthase beta subunit
VDYWTIHRPPLPLAERVTRTEIFTTGIKALDLLAPLEAGGKAGLFVGAGVAATGRYRRERQSAITSELLDVVAGFQAAS